MLEETLTKTDLGVGVEAGLVQWVILITLHPHLILAEMAGLGFVQPLQDLNNFMAGEGQVATHLILIQASLMLTMLLWAVPAAVEIVGVRHILPLPFMPHNLEKPIQAVVPGHLEVQIVHPIQLRVQMEVPA
jgi:hypothetical protein